MQVKETVLEAQVEGLNIVHNLANKYHPIFAESLRPLLGKKLPQLGFNDSALKYFNKSLKVFPVHESLPELVLDVSGYERLGVCLLCDISVTIGSLGLGKVNEHKSSLTVALATIEDSCISGILDVVTYRNIYSYNRIRQQRERMFALRDEIKQYNDYLELFPVGG